MIEKTDHRSRLITLLPLLAVAALLGLFGLVFWQGRDPATIPSTLIGRPTPPTDLPPLEGLLSGSQQVPGFSAAQFKGDRVTLVNVFASWCAPCRLEHPVLMRLAAEGKVRLVGLNYKDSTDNALRFLTGLGNPYTAVGVDKRGRTAIDWGVYGVPETFVVAPDGTVAYKVIGPLSDDLVQSVLLPEIAKAALRKSVALKVGS